MAEPAGLNPLVELRAVSKHFGEGERRVDALADIAMAVFPGEVVGLVGPSGSGKTTLLNVIGCVTEPNGGWMHLNGEVVYDEGWLRRDLRRLRLEKIGFIFQTHNLLPFLTAIFDRLDRIFRLRDGRLVSTSNNAALVAHALAGGAGGQLARKPQPLITE